MISRYTTRQGLTWIDLESPTKEEADAISEEYSLHPLITNELVTSSERAKVDIYENGIYVILHFPIRNRTTGRIRETEIDFVLLENTLITTHYELVDPLHDFAKIFEANSYISSARFGEHAGFLFFAQMKELYKHTLFLLESVEHDIRDIEHKIFAGQETAMVSHLSRVSRTIIDLKSALRSHTEMIKSFSASAQKMYGPEFANYASMIEGECLHVTQALEESRQMVQDLRRTNDSLLSAKTNATMRRLTAINVVLLPLGLISWIFAMNSKYLYLDDPKRLIAVLASMVFTCLILIIYFRSKKWL
ncbi:MAG: CorA family divalent cation transporter [bacterium]